MKIDVYDIYKTFHDLKDRGLLDTLAPVIKESLTVTGNSRQEYGVEDWNGHVTWFYSLSRAQSLLKAREFASNFPDGKVKIVARLISKKWEVEE